MTTTDLYRNLTKRCWSLRQGGRVVAAAALADVTLHASEPARQRYLRTGHRTVHAWARGTLVDAPRPAGAVRLLYRPVEAAGFRTPHGMPARKANSAWFESDGTAWATEADDDQDLDTQRST
ncbi:MAG: hypothetical protein MIL41_20385 [Hyphomicrobiales bacterium]|jgi:hypothetical protein